MAVERVDSSHVSTRLSSEILDRLPPQNLDAEKGVLGSILLDPNLCDDVVMILRPEDFYAEANQKLRVAMERARSLAEAAEAASHAKGRFLAAMSHEIMGMQ